MELEASGPERFAQKKVDVRAAWERGKTPFPPMLKGSRKVYIMTQRDFEVESN